MSFFLHRKEKTYACSDGYIKACYCMNVKNILFLFMTLFSLSAPAQELMTESRMITLEGIRLHFRQAGSGPALLLLHGFTLSSEQWTPFTETLATDYTVIAVDMPGHGRSDRLPSGFSFRKWASLLLNLLREMGIRQVKAIGHSAGAITLMHMASEDTAMITSMILVSGGHRYMEEAREALRQDSFEQAPDAVQVYYMDMHFQDTSKISKLFEDIQEVALQIAVSPEDVKLSKAMIEKISIPVLLVWGDRDGYFPMEIATELYSLFEDAQLWVVPGQGHAPIWTRLGGDPKAEAIFPDVAVSFFKGHDSR